MHIASIYNRSLHRVYLQYIVWPSVVCITAGLIDCDQKWGENKTVQSTQAL